jgi:sigma-B regulation protein RsbU (phosphoserine phosphatase)
MSIKGVGKVAYKVLIADDMLVNRKLIRRALEQRIEDVDFHEAEDGEKALKYIFKNRVDIIILDLIMPNKDGFEVIKELKSSRKYRDIPIIVNSAVDEIGVIQRALELGATDYFTKPLTMEQMGVVLPVKVKNALKAYEQKRLLVQMNQRMREELEFATVLQSILIDESKSLPGIDMVGRYIPSAELSGDYYECLQTGDKTWLLIADVSGHGVASAMIASMIKVMFQNLVELYTSPAQVLESMNVTFYNLTHGAYYITAFLGLIEDGVFTYCNGGHPYPVILDSRDNRTYMLEENGLILGVMEDYKYKTYSREINPGDYIFMYTDGLLEPKVEGHAMRTCNDFFDYIDEHKDMVKGDLALLLDSIVEDFGKASTEELRDDVAVIVMKIKEWKSP